MAARGMRAATVRLFQTTIDCGLLKTKQQLAWLCEMPPTRGYPHP
jgi:hypothetical protein